MEISTNDNIARYAAVYHIDSPDIPDSAEWREWADKEGEWVSKSSPELLQSHPHDLQED